MASVNASRKRPRRTFLANKRMPLFSQVFLTWKSRQTAKQILPTNSSNNELETDSHAPAASHKEKREESDVSVEASMKYIKPDVEKFPIHESRKKMESRLSSTSGLKSVRDRERSTSKGSSVQNDHSTAEGMALTGGFVSPAQSGLSVGGLRGLGSSGGGGAAEDAFDASLSTFASSASRARRGGGGGGLAAWGASPAVSGRGPSPWVPPAATIDERPSLERSSHGASPPPPALVLACTSFKEDPGAFAAEPAGAVGGGGGGGAGDLGEALLDACGAGCAGTAAELLAQGADPGFRDPDDGWTPLHLAAAAGHLEVVELLLTRGGAGVVPDRRDLAGRTPLWWACYAGHLPVLRRLALGGAKLDICDEEGYYPGDKFNSAASDADQIFDVVTPKRCQEVEALLRQLKEIPPQGHTEEAGGASREEEAAPGRGAQECKSSVVNIPLPLLGDSKEEEKNERRNGEGGSRGGRGQEKHPPAGKYEGKEVHGAWEEEKELSGCSSRQQRGPAGTSGRFLTIRKKGCCGGTSPCCLIC